MTDAPAAGAHQVGGWDVILAEADALYAPVRWVTPHAEENESAWLPCHVLLCRRGDERVLVDCGLGVFHDAFEEIPTRTVDVVEVLAAAGWQPKDVSAIVLTHFDPDHCGGVVSGSYPDGLEPTFADVPVFVSAAALALAEGRGATPGEHAEQLLSALTRSGVRVTGVPDGQAAVQGMRLRDAPGHREGHAVVEIDDGDAKLVFLADAVHAREHVEHPEWDTLHDSDPELGLATRRALIAELAGSAAVVACSHVGGFGRIEHSADGSAVWVDVP